MAQYKYEEHRCPMCEHRFVVLMSSNKYAIRVGDDTPHIRTDCPKCGTKLFIASNAACGCIAELVPEDNIRIIGLTI